MRDSIYLQVVSIVLNSRVRDRVIRRWIGKSSCSAIIFSLLQFLPLLAKPMENKKNVLVGRKLLKPLVFLENNLLVLFIYKIFINMENYKHLKNSND